MSLITTSMQVQPCEAICCLVGPMQPKNQNRTRYDATLFRSHSARLPPK
jgi:hypothetical protein